MRRSACRHSLVRKGVAFSFMNIATTLKSGFSGWFIPLALILAVQGGAIHLLSLPERDLPTPPLNNLPAQLDNWQVSSEGALDEGVLEYLKPNSYVLRDYSNRADQA